MEETAVDPLATDTAPNVDLSKEPEVCEEAQDELSNTDILVCGECHEVSYFIEDFKEHKTDGKCPKVPGVRCENEEKPQIWAFTLWKVKQVRILKEKGGEALSSWEMYQKWVKLSTEEKAAWVTAGAALQSCNRIASAKIQEIKVEKDPLGLDDDEKSTIENEGNPTPRCKLLLGEPNKGIRSGVKEEFNVEKIVGKRFNPRKRFWEYHVKWENYKEQTWEPLTNLGNCRDLVDEFELKLKEQKAKDKPIPSPRGRGRPRINAIGASPVKVVKKPDSPVMNVLPSTPDGGRPQRSSKQKALSQVKQWCGNISDEEGGTQKRSYDGDSDDSVEKKIKLDVDSDESDDEPQPPPKKVTKIITYNNGIGKKGLPDNVLIPDAKGVVRISQKQLPSLSSGVYIMSRSSGIIKLDPAASKIATSGGQAIVKVGPKAGQTQIRIIKKDDQKREIPILPKTLSGKVAIPPLTSMGSTTPKIVATMVKKDEKKSTPGRKMQPAKKTQEVKKADVRKSQDSKKLSDSRLEEESDDGIEPLEFPTDLPLPLPESPPGDFVLDPLTGKIAGQSYPSPEPEVVIHEIPSMKADNIETIDSIVQMAAADITEEDLKAEDPLATTPSVTIPQATPIKFVETKAKVGNADSATKASNSSILSTAIANSNILQKTLMSPAAAASKTVKKPRILNQTITKSRSSGGIVRPSPSPKPQIIRSRVPSTSKPKFNISPTPVPRRPVVGAPRRIGNTIISVTPRAVVKSSGSGSPSVHVKARPSPTRPAIINKSKPPIKSMPSLTDDEPGGAASADVVMPSALSSLTASDDDNPVYITGDDGTIYRVAGQNEDGQTILVTEDGNGQQQCLLVTSEPVQEEAPEQPEQQEVVMKQESVVEQEEEEAVEVPEDTVHAQVLSAEPPSPGGTRKVMVMLPSGEVMVTHMSKEDCINLELN